MQRQFLRLVLVLGALVTLVGGTGLYAVFNDQASLGNNQVDSGELAPAAYLQIATGQVIADEFICDTFVDDVTTGLISMSDAQPGNSTDGGFCLINAGSAPLDVSVVASGLDNLDLDCTGDEASVDESCEAGGTGELSQNLVVSVREVLCATGQPPSSLVGTAALDDLVGTPILLRAGLAIYPGTTFCGYWTVRYSDTTDTAAVQAAQTDRASWAFTFTGTAE